MGPTATAEAERSPELAAVLDETLKAFLASSGTDLLFM